MGIVTMESNVLSTYRALECAASRLYSCAMDVTVAQAGVMADRNTVMRIAFPSAIPIWYFGYKAHIGVDKESGLVHTVKVTAANEHDVTVTSELLTGDEEYVYEDSSYLGAEKRPGALKNKAGKSVHYKINRRPSQSKKNSARSQAQIKRCEHEKSSVRAKVEQVFAVVKLQLRFRKTRYRGLQKQIAKMNIMFALANLILADRPCLAA